MSSFRSKRSSEDHKRRKSYTKQAEKLKKLARSNYGRWLAQSLRRAGTVQALQGATTTDLEQLAHLKATCNKANGFNGSTAYELSHLYPVDGELGIGRMLPINLRIAPIKYNRQRGNANFNTFDERYYLPYEVIDKQFLVDTNSTNLKVLTKLQQLLGSTFNSWLKSFTLNPPYREQVRALLNKQSPSIKIPANASVDKLRQIAEENNVYLYDISCNLKDAQEVALDELERLGLQNTLVYKVLCKWQDSIFGPDLPTLPEGYWSFVVEQSMNLLHGLKADDFFENRELLNYFSNESK